MDANYLKNLTKLEREILHNKGTENPFSGEYNDMFLCGVFL